MKFIDEATIKVTAGKGGDGCLSFRREKYIPFGGPDGGDGGDGGSIYLIGNPDLNTLVDFRYKRIFKVKSGAAGSGKKCTGRSSEDLFIPVPLGTLVYDNDTEELLGDITQDGQTLKVAQGGFHGLGNTRFKSSINRAPRKITKGSRGEARQLRLELKLLADVGLIGLPNAGKSTFVRSVSAARPKVADYPFTTLHPNLGVVRVETDRSFVIADIPGLIEGAAEGAGLGIQFLKHISRTRLLLHLVDVSSNDQSDSISAVKKIENELKKFSEELIKKPRWLVLNKIDLISEENRKKHCDEIIKQLGWKGKVFTVSALEKEGLKELVFEVSEVI